MNAGKSQKMNVILAMAMLLLAACGPKSTPTPELSREILVTNIIEDDEVVGQIEQTKLFDQCQSSSALKTQIQFSESNSETTQKELVISAGVTGGVDIEKFIKLELQGAVEEHFAVEKNTSHGKQEMLAIEVPGGTRQEYKIIWNDIRRRGTVEYLENGISKFANYNYRIGVELASSTVKDIDCSIQITPSPTAAIPTETPVPEPTVENNVIIEKYLTDGCVFSKTWQVDSTDADALSGVSINPDGCYSLSPLGISATNSGVLRFYENEKKYSIASGIYTPITDKSVIEFDIYVNYLYIPYPDNPIYVSFAAAPANDTMKSKAAARFKLQVENTGDRPLIFFVLADAGESIGSKVSNQHYEYGRKYKIRLELSGVAMSVYINGLKMDEDLAIPDGPKVFYIGYNLPLVAGMDIEITNITVDGMSK
jgi:hypothetical protein